MNPSDENTVVTSVWRTMRLVFGVVPIVAGLDKFLNLLVYWPKYIAALSFARLGAVVPHARHVRRPLEHARATS